MKKLGEGGSLKSDIKKIEKLVKDQILLENMVEELKAKNEEIEGNLQETKAIIENGVNQMADLKKENEELKMNAQKLKEERDAEIEKSLQYQSENVANLKLILDLKTTESKLTSDLENYKTTDADLVISNRELKECNNELETEMKKVVELKSKNAKITSELESGSADYIITKQELRDCEEELEDEIQKNENLQIFRSLASTNRRRAQECQHKLEVEIDAKEILQKKFESFRPSWSEWSSCSENCDGVKTRMDQCSFNNKETEPCNDNCSGESMDGEFMDGESMDGESMDGESWSGESWFSDLNNCVAFWQIFAKRLYIADIITYNDRAKNCPQYFPWNFKTHLLM